MLLNEIRLQITSHNIVFRPTEADLKKQAELFSGIVLQNLSCAKSIERRLKDMLDVKAHSEILEGEDNSSKPPKTLTEATNKLLQEMKMATISEGILKKRLHYAEERHPDNFDLLRKFIQKTTNMPET